MQRVKQPSVLPGSQRSWWLQEALDAEGHPAPAAALDCDLDVDVAIVGGGYTGLWTALALRDRSASISIALVEADVCGAGASGKNGGFVHGYWSALPRLARTFGDEVALEVAHLGSQAQDAIRAVCLGRDVDVWWREAGILKVSCSPAQDAAVERLLATTRRLNVAGQAEALSAAEVQQRCQSPRFRAGALLTDAATVQPARLARALRRAAIARGIGIYERTPVIDVQVGSPNVLVTGGGGIRARDVVLASNAALTGWRPTAKHLTNFSSYMVLTEPLGDRLASIHWTGGEGIDDARMFVHYFRTTPDGRVAMGSGSGPIGFGGRIGPGLTSDAASAARAQTALHRLLPGLGEAKITHAWGGPIDVSADHLPFFGTLPENRVHYGCGYSGHGVDPSWIGGTILASLVLGERNAWTRSAFCNRRVPSLPPEPLRFIGGRMVRAAIIRCEEAEEDEQPAPLLARFGAAIPRIFGLRVGTR